MSARKARCRYGSISFSRGVGPREPTPFFRVQSALKHPRSTGLSDREIARHVGVGHNVVSEWRRKTPPSVLKVQIDPPATRTAVRNGKPYQMDVSGIGRTPKRGHGKRPAGRGLSKENRLWWYYHKRFPARSATSQPRRSTTMKNSRSPYPQRRTEIASWGLGCGAQSREHQP